MAKRKQDPVSRAYAAEEKLRRIAQTRRPTAAETAAANRAYAAAARVQKRGLSGSPSEHDVRMREFRRSVTSILSSPGGLSCGDGIRAVFEAGQMRAEALWADEASPGALEDAAQLGLTARRMAQRACGCKGR